MIPSLLMVTSVIKVEGVRGREEEGLIMRGRSNNDID
jgi:hypothetical protein